MAFNIAEFRKRRKIKYWLGSILFWVGVFFIPLDMFSAFPTPVKGAFVWALWIPMAVIGGILWCFSKKLPLEETMGIAREHDNELSVTELVSELGVTIGTAEAVLDALRRKGYAKSQKRGHLTVWVFTDSRDVDGIKKNKRIVDSETGMTAAQLDDFLEPCEAALGELKLLLKQLQPKTTFKQTVQDFSGIVRQHIDNFRDDPTDVSSFENFPDYIEKMGKLVKDHIRLSKHDDRKAVHDTLHTIEDTVDKSRDSMSIMLDRLLVNDLQNARAESKTMERLLELDRKIR